MHPNETQQFFNIWDDRSRAYEKPLADRETKILAFKLLKGFTLDQISNALKSHISDPSVSRYIPRAPDIIRQILMHSNNQFPGAEEAWALFPRDESLSACICEEMARAWGVANELDEISGRMAFKETYSREVAKSQQLGRRPKWFITIGHDKQHLEQVALDAITQSLMSPEAAKVYLPHIPLDDLQRLADKKTTASKLLESHAQTVNNLDQLMLEAPVEHVASIEIAKSHLAGINALLKTSEAPKRQQDQPTVIAEDAGKIAAELEAIRKRHAERSS